MSTISSQFGVSFSVKQCRNFGVDPGHTLSWLIGEAGFRRFRLMSYWDEHEKAPGVYNFKQLDTQIKMITRAGGIITLCLGARQPRWPENHWPDWAWNASKEDRSKALLAYIQVVVERYKDNPAIISYQLENEALLTNFGHRAEVDRGRLRQEFALVKELDPTRPVIMTTSTSWGIPLRRPIPNIVGFSYYRTLFNKGAYRNSIYQSWIFKLRALLIRIIWWKPSFIHEMQCEPWGPKNIWEMDIAAQNESMSVAHIQKNIRESRKTNLHPIDLWGGEWWYWRLTVLDDPSIYGAVKRSLVA
jgi:hypothetical protein